jgi:HAD superfamily hydrolase (TIGR01509 family)
MLAAMIIFDCDGVLIDSERIAADVSARQLAELGIAVTGDTLLERFSDVPDREMYQILTLESGVTIPADHAERTHALKLGQCEAVGESLAMPGIHACLDAINGASICVASSSLPQWIEQNLRQARLWDYFVPHVFSAAQVQRGKPAPDLFLLAAERMKIPPAQCVVIEDSVAGIAAAVAAGMTPVGFAGGCHCGPAHADRLHRAGAQTVFATMPALTDYLLSR